MKAFWIIYELLLLGCEALFILRLASVFKALAKIKRRYAFAPVELVAGHRVQPTRAEILPGTGYSPRARRSCPRCAAAARSLPRGASSPPSQRMRAWTA